MNKRLTLFTNIIVSSYISDIFFPVTNLKTINPGQKSSLPREKFRK